jgi:AcrR family transcriptional regulator
MAVMSEPRRRLSPDDRRSELLALGAEVFGQRPYDEVRIDEIAERAGVSRALMYHYFPDKRAFFAAVVRAEGERLFEATNAPPEPGQNLFQQLRAGVLAYLRYDEEHPHGAWAAYIGMGTSDPVLRGIEDLDNDRQANRIMSRIGAAVGAGLDSKVERDLRITIYGWLAFTFEMCRQRILDPSIDAGYIADTCAHTLLDAIGRTPNIPAELADAIAHSRD